jgi:hypothetical protein
MVQRQRNVSILKQRLLYVAARMQKFGSIGLYRVILSPNLSLQAGRQLRTSTMSALGQAGDSNARCLSAVLVYPIHAPACNML